MSPSLKQAAFLHPTFPTLVIFFSGNQYVVVDAKGEGRNGSIVFGPRFIAEDYPSLVRAGFDSGVDAVLPNPKDLTTAYFFSGGKYALVKVAPPGGPQLSTLIDGPHDLSQRNQINLAGYKSIDAVLTIPSGGTQAYIFSGDTYITSDIDPASTGNVKVASIAAVWASLDTLGFAENLTVAFPVPGEPLQAYFFKGDKYSGVGNIRRGTRTDSFNFRIENTELKPVPVGRGRGDTILGSQNPKDVATEWPALKEAQFF